MSNPQFSNEQIQQWADEVSDQLNEITVQESKAAGALRFGEKPSMPLVPEQLRGRIEAATGESAESFWKKIKVAAHDDLCKEGGHLHTEWKKYQDLPTKDVVQWTITFLSAIGLAIGSSAGLAVVPIAVWILHALLNIGITTICQVSPPPAEEPPVPLT